MSDLKALLEKVEAELWRPVEGFPDYEVSSIGRVRSNKRGRTLILKAWRPSNPKYYPAVSLCRDGSRMQGLVHAMVLRAFVGPPPTPQHEVRHLDGDHLNPRLENLAWGTRKENAADRTRHGRTPKGPDHALFGRGMPGSSNGFSKLNEDAAQAIRLLAGKMSQRKIASAFGVDQGVVWRVIHRRNWRHVA